MDASDGDGEGEAIGPSAKVLARRAKAVGRAAAARKQQTAGGGVLKGHAQGPSSPLGAGVAAGAATAGMANGAVAAAGMVNSAPIGAGGSGNGRFPRGAIY